MGRALAVVAVLAAVARADVREKVKKTKKYAEDTGFDWSTTSDGWGAAPLYFKKSRHSSEARAFVCA